MVSERKIGRMNRNIDMICLCGRFLEAKDEEREEEKEKMGRKRRRA